MSKPAALLGDPCSGHGCHPPRQSASGASSNVTINGKKVLLMGAYYPPHTCQNNTHDGLGIATTSKVKINGKFVLRSGDPVSCGSTVIGTSRNVTIG